MPDPNPNVNPTQGDNNNTNQGGDPNAGGGTNATKWYEASVPKELHDHVKGYQDLGAMVKDVVETKGKLPKVPDKADGYVVNLDGTPVPKESAEGAKKYYEGLREQAKQMGLTQAQFDNVVKIDIQRRVEIEKQSLSQFEKEKETLKKDWGNDYDVNLQKAEKAFAAIFEDEDVQFFKKSGVADNPRFVRAMWRLSSKVSEDSFVKNQNQTNNGEPKRDPVTGTAMLNYPSMK